MKGSQWGGKQTPVWQETARAPTEKIIQKRSVRFVCIPSWCRLVADSFYHFTQTDFPQAPQSLQVTFDKRLFFVLFTQGNSGRHSPAIDPERDPWQHHHKCGWKVCLQQEEEDVASQREVDVETIVPACKHNRERPAQVKRIL